MLKSGHEPPREEGNSAISQSQVVLLDSVCALCLDPFLKGTDFFSINRKSSNKPYCVCTPISVIVLPGTTHSLRGHASTSTLLEIAGRCQLI